MIYINPTGGLGNTLFQIAGTYSLALDNDDTLCLLNVKKNINDLNNDIRLGTHHAEKYRWILDKFKQFDFAPLDWKENQQYSMLFEHNSFQKKYVPFSYVPLEYNKECEYVGYFQSEKYFTHRRQEILELYKPADEFIETIEKYSHLFGSIFMHVRRGDYVKEHKGRYVYLDLEYYNKALSLLPDSLPVLIFSDDIEWCKKYFSDKRFIFIDEPDYISLHIMAMMKYSVIANSTFGWWGAWLGEMDKVIAPKEWFGDGVSHKNNEQDIIPNSWVKI